HITTTSARSACARRLLADGLEVRLLEGRRQDLHAVDAAAGGDEFGHQPRHVLPPPLVALCSLVGLDLDSAGATQLGGRALCDDRSAVQDHDAVADQLDLAQ